MFQKEYPISLISTLITSKDATIERPVDKY